MYISWRLLLCNLKPLQCSRKKSPQLKNTACYCVGPSVLTPTVKVKKQKLSPPAKCHANKS